MPQSDGEVPDEYRGREQSLVKHTVLESYLMRLLMIVGQKRADTLAYVDCFAGPWESETDDLSDTSIDIAIRQMEKAHEWFAENDRFEPPNFKAVFVEQDDERYSRLDQYLQERTRNLPENFELYSEHGDFRGARRSILDVFIPDDFVFFFIDPKGWKHVTPDVLRPFLKRENSELLITFMFDFVNRFPDHLEDVTGLGREDIEDLSGDERERRVLHGYREQLKAEVATSGQVRTAYVRVKAPEAERTKYHLVYVTKHHKGIVTFMEESEDIEKEEQPIIRAARAQREAGQTSLLGPAQMSMPAERTPTEDLRELWLETLSVEPRVFNEKDFADMLERSDCFPSDLQETFYELWKEGRVENLDASDSSMKRRSTNYVNFEDGERLALTDGGSKDE